MFKNTMYYIDSVSNRTDSLVVIEKGGGVKNGNCFASKSVLKEVFL